MDDEEDDEGDVEVAAKAAKTSDPETEQKVTPLSGGSSRRLTGSYCIRILSS